MKNFLTANRSSGILAHFTSLPSPYGVGDIGIPSFQFIDFLVKANQSYWQFLPTGPTNSMFDNSPYMSTSAFAGSPMLISLEQLYQDGYLQALNEGNSPIFSPYNADFIKAEKFKKQLLKKAYISKEHTKDNNYQNFIATTPWLEDYALFMTLKEIYSELPWYSWPESVANRDPQTLSKIKENERELLDYYYFEQFIFFSQWDVLKKYAEKSKIKLFGDIPIYVGLDSADVWANQDIFTLDAENNLPTEVAGVPPDYFSETGQRWGNPLYRWDSDDQLVSQQLEEWWHNRLNIIFKQVDVARIDHFRGFESYWAIPSENDTAIEGEWKKGPGRTIFDKIQQKTGPLNIVAEDLGIITEAVNELRDELDFPGMKVLQFAFDDNPNNSFLPHNFATNNCIVYTGTHDNDTTVGWFLSDKLSDKNRINVKEYANRKIFDETGIHQDMIHLALSSIASLSIFPLQDILGFGNDCKMNSPGIATGNWAWRCAPQYISSETANWLNEKTSLFGRGRKEQIAL